MRRVDVKKYGYQVSKLYNLALMVGCILLVVAVSFTAKNIYNNYKANDLYEGNPVGDLDGILKSISVYPSRMNLKVGESGSLSVDATDEDGDVISVTSSASYRSADSSVASVSGNRVTAKGPGRVNITVSYTEDGVTKTGTCTVIVTQPVTGVTLDTNLIHLEVNDTRNMIATVTPSDASNKNLTWEIGDETIATVDSNGLVTAKGAGTTWLRVTTEDGGYFATCAIQVVASVTSISLNKTSLTLNVGQSETLVATISPSNATNQNVIWTSSDSNVTVDANGKVTAVKAGTSVIRATSAENDEIVAMCNVTVNVPVDGVSLTASLNDLSVGETMTLVATVSPSNAANKTVRFTSSDTSIATVDLSSGVVKGVSAGKVTITVKTVDGGFTDTFDITVHSVVSVTGVSLNKTSLSLSVDETATLIANVIPSNATNSRVIWTSSYPSIATVENGKVTAISEGSALISATTEDGYKVASCQVTVSPKGISVTSVLIAGNDSELYVGETDQMSVTVLPSNATNKNVTYSSSDTSVATVSSSGLVTAIKEGTTMITVTTVDGGKTDEWEVIVKTKPVTSVPVTNVYLAGNDSELYVGETDQLSVTVLPSNATTKLVRYSSSDTSVATVSSSGLVTAIKEGTAMITVTTVDGGKTDEWEVIVKTKPVTSVSVTNVYLAGNDSELYVGETDQLSVTVLPSNATTKLVRYSSSDTSVATVSSSGLVTAIKEGTAMITVTTVDGGKTDEWEVIVKTKPSGSVNVNSVSLNKSKLGLVVGQTGTLTATVLPSNANNNRVYWKSSDTSVAEVDANGRVTAKAIGTATITVTTADGNKTDTCVVTVTYAGGGSSDSGDTTIAVTSVSLNKDKIGLLVGGTGSLVATVNPSNASNQAVLWTSSDTSVATVDNNGNISAKAVGTAIITVTTVNGAKTDTCTVTVAESNISGDENVSVTEIILNKNSLGLINGGSETLIATVLPTNAANRNVSWASSNPNVATVDSNGKVIGISAGTTTITATTVDGGKTATCTVMVSSSEETFQYLIADIKINGYPFTFNNEITDYELAISNEESLEFNVMLSSSDYTYVITGNENLSDGKVITVWAQGDNRIEEYRFMITSPVGDTNVDVPSTALNSPLIMIISSIIFITVGGSIGYYMMKKAQEKNAQ